jgi:hypothetical protein
LKKYFALAAAVLAIVGAFYFGSPYWTASNFRDTITSGNVDDIEQTVDFPSVRESLKSQMNLALTEKMQNDPEMQNNPFAGLGMMLMPAIVEKAVDAYVTPEGLAKLAQGKAIGDETPTEGADGELEFQTEWVGLDRFRVTIEGEEAEDTGAGLLFERKGFADWKLIKLELPDSAFEGGLDEGSNPPQ